MMKVFVLCLIVVFATTLANAGFFSPNPEKPSPNDDVIEKDDVVVGIEKDDGKTKISVSPKDVDEETDENAGYVSNAKEKLTKKMEEAKERLKGHSQKSTEAVGDVSRKAKDTASDAADAAKQAKEEAERKLAEGVKGGERGVKGIWRRGCDMIGSPARGLRSLASLLHLLGFAVAYGMCVWVTFASSYVMAGALPRGQFAMLQSKIHPVYFKAMAGCVGLSLLGYLMSRVGKGVFAGSDLAAALVMVLANLFYLEPQTSKVENERMKKEKEEGSGKEGHEGSEEKREGEAAVAAKPRIVRTREIMMRRLNSNSAMLNVVTLMPLTWHLVQLAQKLQAAAAA